MSKLFVKTSGEGEPLVVLHGWGMNSAVWQPVRAPLESQFCVSWIDLPGHGESRCVKADSLEEIVDLIIPHIPSNAHLMGWSLGGLIIQAIAQRIPDKIKSMTLVASTPRFSQAEDWQNAMSQEVLSNFADSLIEDIEGTLKRFIALQFMGVRGAKTIQGELTRSVLVSLDKKGSRALARQCWSECDDYPQGALKKHEKGGCVLCIDDALKLGLDILTHSDFRESRLEIPQHWLLAERDRLIPKEVINDLKLIRPDAQITLLENTGHAPFMTHPKEFLESIVPFMLSDVD